MDHSQRGIVNTYPWFLPLLGPLFPTILLLNFGPCVLSLLVKFVFSRLQVSPAGDHMPGISTWPT